MSVLQPSCLSSDPHPAAAALTPQAALRRPGLHSGGSTAGSLSPSQGHRARGAPRTAARPPPRLVLLSLQEQEGGPRSGGSGSVKHQPSAVFAHTNGLLSKTETDIENKLMVTLGESGGIN